MLCRLSRISTVSIKISGDHREYELNPADVLGQVQLHAAGLRCLELQLDTSWTGSDLTWACLGKMVSLTKLELAFGDQVCAGCFARILVRLQSCLQECDTACLHSGVLLCALKFNNTVTQLL
jgi:hypothetical protein